MKLRTIGYYKEMPHGQETDPYMEEFINQEDPEQAEKMSKIADGVIVGSAMVRIAAEYGKDAQEQLSLFVKSMKEKM